VTNIAGCFWFDGRAARAADVVADRSIVQVSGPVVLSCGRSGCLLRDPDVQVAAVLDGRIDEYSRAAVPPDGVRAVIDAYVRDGEDAGRQLIGDFAFAVWDERKSRLVCVRDPMGQRPLFYAVTATCLVFGSELRQVLLHPCVSSRVNEAMVAEHLTGFPATVEETLWQDARRLPPAHALIASRNGVRVRRYWDFIPRERGQADGRGIDAEDLRSVFADAVECRVRNAGRVAVFLSGGIDSSCVAAMTDQLAQQGRGPKISVLSLKFPGRSCDESRYINAVVAATGVDALAMNASPAPARDVIAEVDRSLDVPSYPNGAVLDPLRHRAAELGFDVVLTGYGGDEWYGGRVRSALELIRERQYMAGARSLLAERRTGERHSTAAVVRGVLASAVPAGVRRAIRRRTGPHAPTFDWIVPDFAARVNLRDRLAPRAAPRSLTAEQRRIYALTQSAVQVLGDEAEDRAARAAGIDQRHPFCDRRVAELGFALPSTERANLFQSKVALRRAFRDLLPRIVHDRRDKAEFSSTFVDALEQLGGIDLFKRLASEEAGWVDGGVVRARYARMIQLYRSGSEAYIPWSEGLWEVAGIEMWLDRAVMNRGSCERSA
jgi:asparagine synthase (glutamine-hydrolysing)